MDSQTVCGAPKTEGGPCQSEIGLCELCGRCLMHCGHRERKKKSLQRQGGKARAAERWGKGRKPDVYLSADEALPAPETISDCALRLGYLTVAVETGTLSEKRADVARACIRDLKDLLLKDQDKRIHELEQVIAGLKKQRKDGR